MADLPEIVLKEIFDFLSLPERLRMRLTCKKWNFVFETFGCLHSLCLYSTDYPYNERWCCSDQIVAEHDMLHLKYGSEASRRFDLTNELFRNLQKVYLHEIGENIDRLLAQVNCLTRLKVLVLNDRRIQTRALRSSSLERLALKCNEFEHLELDTPNLSALVLARRSGWFVSSRRGEQAIEFRFPWKVKYLQCGAFNLNLSRLSNLQTLVCKEITFDFQLNDFKALTRLEIWPAQQSQLQMVRRIEEQRTSLKRSDLELLVSGFKEQFVFCEFRGDTIVMREAYLKRIESDRCNFVGTAPWKMEIELGLLIKYAGRIPSELFEHFAGCRRLLESYDRLDLKENEFSLSDLIELLKRSKATYWWFSERCWNLSQEFYNQLSHLESIRELLIAVRIENFDFDCFLNFKNLQALFISSERIPIEFIYKFVRQMKFSGYFRFRCSNLFRVDIDFGLRPEEREDPEGRPFYLWYDRFKADWVAFEPSLVHGDKFCHDLDELFRELAVMKEHELIKSFFI